MLTSLLKDKPNGMTFKVVYKIKYIVILTS
jgi:hypothetical protein